MLRDVLVFLAFCVVLMLIAAGYAAFARANDSMVGLLERHFQVTPGATRVLPECGCTVRYLGTAVHGRRYTVTIERLD